MNEIKPEVILINTMTGFSDTKLAEDIEQKNFIPAGEKEILIEEKILEILQYNIDTIDEEKFTKTFRRDHI